MPDKRDTLLVVLGAGASYDAVPHNPPTGKVWTGDRLPLANDLFARNELTAPFHKQFNKMLPIVPRLAGAANVEAKLRELLDEAPDDPARKSQLMAVRFYIAAVVAKAQTECCPPNDIATNLMTLYDRLRLAVGVERIVFVTFNYDTLLEDALRNCGREFRDEHSYHGCVEQADIFKLHGSIDWYRLYDLANASRYTSLPGTIDRIIQYPDEGRSDGQFVMHPRRFGRYFEESMVTIPAIAIPLENKSDYECLQQHLKAMRHRLRDVGRILTIGWRGGERHFLNDLRENIGDTTFPIDSVVGPGGGEELRKNLRQRLLGWPLSTYEQGFTEYIKSSEFDDFLSSLSEWG